MVVILDRFDPAQSEAVLSSLSQKDSAIAVGRASELNMPYFSDHPSSQAIQLMIEQVKINMQAHIYQIPEEIL